MPIKNKKKSNPRRLSLTSFPVPAPEAVADMERKLFSGRFVDDHLSALLGRASVAISAEFHQDVRRHRLPIPHWRILAALSDGPGMSLAELADLTLITQPTVTRLVQRLERQSLIRKSAHPRDRRMLRIALTDRGAKRVRDLIAIAEERQERILDGLDDESLKAALRYLIAFCAAKRRRRRPLPQLTF
jgi:MarR family transcriptional regulator, organic hydroperoxide resistance regulator